MTTMSNNAWGLEPHLVHAGAEPDPTTGVAPGQKLDTLRQLATLAEPVNKISVGASRPFRHIRNNCESRTCSSIAGIKQCTSMRGHIENAEANNLGGGDRAKHDRRAGDLQAAKHDQGHQEER